MSPLLLMAAHMPPVEWPPPPPPHTHTVAITVLLLVSSLPTLELINQSERTLPLSDQQHDKTASTAGMPITQQSQQSVLASEDCGVEEAYWPPGWPAVHGSSLCAGSQIYPLSELATMTLTWLVWTAEQLCAACLWHCGCPCTHTTHTV